MPRVGINARARKARGALGHAIRQGKPLAEIEVLRLEYRRAKAETLREAADRELAEVEALVAGTRAEQGLPRHVEDGATLGSVADVLRLPAEARRGATGRASQSGAADERRRGWVRVGAAIGHRQRGPRAHG